MKTYGYMSYYVSELTKIEHDNLLLAVNNFNNRELREYEQQFNHINIACIEMSPKNASGKEYELLFSHIPADMYDWLRQFVGDVVAHSTVMPKKRKYRTVKMH